MPVYNANAVPGLYPGDTYKVFDAETPGADVASQQVALAPAADGSLSGFQIDYTFLDGSGVPGQSATAVTLYVQVAPADAAGNYQTIDTLSSTSGGSSPYGGVFARFVRVVAHALTIAPATSMTVRITR